jgi:hypothetical protein
MTADNTPQQKAHSNCDDTCQAKAIQKAVDSIILCELCGEPMPKSEQMFKYHGFSGPCPKPPLQPKAADSGDTRYKVETLLYGFHPDSDDEALDATIDLVMKYVAAAVQADRKAYLEKLSDYIETNEGDTSAGSRILKILGGELALLESDKQQEAGQSLTSREEANELREYECEFDGEKFQGKPYMVVKLCPKHRAAFDKWRAAKMQIPAAPLALGAVTTNHSLKKINPGSGLPARLVTAQGRSLRMLHP